MDPIENVSDVNIPIMFSHGSRDRLVPIEEAFKVYEKANGPKEFLKVRGLHNHYLLNGDNLEYENSIVRFFSDYL